MNKRSQLQWMLLLVAAVVVLPTVSLLWFMGRAVANEHLVIRQKLQALYEGRLKEAADKTQERFQSRLKAFDQQDWSRDPYGLLRLASDQKFQGVAIWSPDGLLVYPSIVSPPDSRALSESELSEAWNLEFVQQDYAAAAQEYGWLAADSGDPRALVGQVRCLARIKQWDKAFEAAMANEKSIAAPARLLLLTQLKEANAFDEQMDLAALLIEHLAADLFKPGDEYLPASQNLMVANRFLEVVRDEDFAGKQALLERLELFAGMESRSLAVQEGHPVPTGPAGSIMTESINGERMHMVRHATPYGEIRLVLTDAGLMAMLDGYRDEFSGSEVHFRILDGQGRFLGGEDGETITTIVSGPLPAGFPEGKVELYFSNGDIFDQAAERQIAVYVWTGALVILLMLAVGAFAVQAVGRQIRLNKMKNDFIATVSHELRTPLASMRLLVDTLLEKRVRDEEHAEQYLRLIAKENERLTRMIENFLTFSRMERNKNAFTMAAVAPKKMVEEAIEAVCTKYEANHCQLSLQVADDLPEIAAEPDAIVTVLINLLDNACKYTADDKRIALSVFADGGEVCFSVADNGIGLSRRQIRRIFDSFYQVDSSLTRMAEGCGLGLSIVQFIVNAHKGRIDVESQPGKGSTFTVRLPVARRNGAHTQNGNGTDH